MFPKRTKGPSRWIPKIQAIVITFLVVAPLYSFAAELNHCSDADTCWVKEDGREFKVRLTGVDAPESDQPYGKEAKRFINNWLGHKPVDLKCQGVSFDRKTCDIFYQGQDVSWTLVREGYAWDFPEFSKGKYAQVQKEAEAARAGLWKDANPTSPHCWRWAGTKECNANSQYQP